MSIADQFTPKFNPSDQLSSKDNKVSNCKICGSGIFKQHKYEWARGAYTGLVHTSCLQKFLGEVYGNAA